MDELLKIPNVGKVTQRDLHAMGYHTIDSLKGIPPEILYEQECCLRGVRLDKCQLYVYRAIAYWVNTDNPDPMLAKWWNFSDDNLTKNKTN